MRAIPAKVTGASLDDDMWFSEQDGDFRTGLTQDADTVAQPPPSGQSLTEFTDTSSIARLSTGSRLCQAVFQVLNLFGESFDSLGPEQAPG